ncbi:hypothetical protein HPB51_028606 [Rhipicephalus microplus]|uniref:Uncharacterized protein n=1 Tax=Rhipicephalus microplus TaxID=6941 RepID=A0A9J6CWV9_RHIMP|nr:hypothetical protein HPB51_028606 [Rhipicephalus microplus]
MTPICNIKASASSESREPQASSESDVLTGEEEVIGSEAFTLPDEGVSGEQAVVLKYPVHPSLLVLAICEGIPIQTAVQDFERRISTCRPPSTTSATMTKTDVAAHTSYKAQSAPGRVRPASNKGCGYLVIAGFCPHYRRPATACLAGCIVCRPGKPPTCYQRRRTFCLPSPWHPCFRIFGSATPPSVYRRDKSSHPIAVDNIPCAAYKTAATIQRALWASRLCHHTGRLPVPPDYAERGDGTPNRPHNSGQCGVLYPACRRCAV